MPPSTRASAECAFSEATVNAPTRGPSSESTPPSAMETFHGPRSARPGMPVRRATVALNGETCIDTRRKCSPAGQVKFGSRRLPRG